MYTCRTPLHQVLTHAVPPLVAPPNSVLLCALHCAKRTHASSGKLRKGSLRLTGCPGTIFTSPCCHLVCVVCPGAQLLEHAGDGAWNDTPVHIALSPASYGESLPRPSLSVCKHCAVVALKCADHNWLSNSLKHLAACQHHHSVID